MKKMSYVLILPLVVVSGLVFSSIKNYTQPATKPLSPAAMKARMVADKKKWEASPDGLRYKAWEVSAAGKKVRASHDKIKPYIKAFTNMEAVVTSVTFEREKGKPGPKWLLVKMEGEDYMMQYTAKEFEKLKGLKVNDKIMVKSHSAGYSPNHPYLIVSGDVIAQNHKVLFKRDFSKNKGC